MADQVQQQTEGLAFRNPVDALGFGMVHHVLTLDHELSDGAYRLYALLLKYARDKSGCWPGRKRLAKDLGKSVATIERRLAELVKHGLITRQQRLHRTAMTWIEDLRDVYADAIPIKNEGDVQTESIPLKNAGDMPIKDDEDVSPSFMREKQHTEEKSNTMHVGDGVSIHEKQQSIAALRSFGVAQTMADRLAQRRHLREVLGWIIYARHADGLRNPVGFVVARLRDGIPVPDEIGEELALAMAWVGDGIPVSNLLDDLDTERNKTKEERASRRYIEGKYADYIQH